MTRRRRLPPWAVLIGALLWLGIFTALVMALVFPQPAQAGSRVRVPEVSPLYRIAIERETARYFGIDAQAARAAAQIHAESAWNPRAQSPFAQGLAQFTPKTARWLPDICPEVGTPDPWDPGWSLRAQSCYMAWLFRRVPQMPGSALSACARWAFALRAYNGGEGWLQRERKATRAAGADPNNWRAVAAYRVRAKWAHRENTAYPRRILLQIEPAYLAAGWPGGPACR